MMRNKESCVSKHNVLHNAQLFCLILCYLPKCFVYSVESSFRGLYFIPAMKMSLCSSQSPLLKAVKPFFIFFSMQLIDVTAFDMFYVFFGWRCPLPLALYSCLFFFCNLFSKLICSIFFSAKTFPDSTNELFLPHHFPKPSANSLHCQFVSVFLLLPSENRCRISGIHWSCVIPHLPVSLRTPPARN